MKAETDCLDCSCCGSPGVVVFGQSIALHAPSFYGWQAFCPNHLCKVGFTAVFNSKAEAVAAWNQNHKATPHD